MSELIIRQYEEGDEVGIVELLTKTFPKWSKQLICDPIDFWGWKYQKNPLKDQYNIVALDGKKIVGCFHSLSLRIKIALLPFCLRR